MAAADHEVTRSPIPYRSPSRRSNSSSVSVFRILATVEAGSPVSSRISEARIRGRAAVKQSRIRALRSTTWTDPLGEPAPGELDSATRFIPTCRKRFDEDAAYLDRRTVDLSAITPYVARPGAVSGEHAIPVSEVERRHVDQCFIGSCANGQLDDVRIAAEILDGRQVADGTRLIVTPASQAVYLEAIKRGYVETIAAAGAVVTNATCGAGFGYHMGVVGDGEVCLTASTRNFRGRMGSPDAEIYMASTQTVASSALTGQITDPTEVLA